MVMTVPTFLNVDGDGTAVPDQGDGLSGLRQQSGPVTLSWDGACRLRGAVSKSSVDDVRERLMTPSQAESPSAPKAIEDQPESRGPYRTVSVISDTPASGVTEHAATTPVDFGLFRRPAPSRTMRGGNARKEGRAWGGSVRLRCARCSCSRLACSSDAWEAAAGAACPPVRRRRPPLGRARRPYPQ